MNNLEHLNYYFFAFIATVIAMTVFNFTRALVSTLQGDTIPKSEGNLSLNPLKSIEPVGLILFIVFGYGWSKPFKTSSVNYKDKKFGTVLTNFLPILVCFMLGVMFRYIWLNYYSVSDGNTVVYYLMCLNSAFAGAFKRIALFNIVPIYPMSGSYILRAYLSPNSAIKYSQYEKLLLVILVFLIVTGVFGYLVNYLPI